MKIIAIGDVHGRDYWKHITRPAGLDMMVFIGDYFDSPYISFSDQFSNFGEIIEWKKSFPNNVTLLIGNHDYHYLPEVLKVKERYSGFQHRHALQISRAFDRNIDLFSMCYYWNDHLFVHAGVTETWLMHAGYNNEPVDIFINELFRNQPLKFKFNGTDPSGDNVSQSPIWVRPASLFRNAYRKDDMKQIVGHTKMDNITDLHSRLYFIDTMSSSPEYLLIEDGVIQVKPINPEQ